SNLPADLITLSLNGGSGNDLIIGSQGSDLVNGGAGDDVAELGDGNDTFVWNPGDGNDTVDGQAGFDRIVFNGSDGPDDVEISANGSRARITGRPGNVAMDLTGVEDVDVNALGGADTITVDDQTATDLFQVNLNLANSDRTGDGMPDDVIINGTDG